jgi:Flp pilus assembly protein TadG
MMRWMRRWRIAGCEGAALIEFAVSCIILMPIFFGFIETCLAFYTYSFVSDAAREASRYAMVRGSNSCAKVPGMTDCNITTATPLNNYVQSLGYPGLNPSKVAVTVNFYKASTTLPTTWATLCAGCNQPGNQVQVKVQYAFPLGIPFWNVTTVGIGSVSSMTIVP